MQNINTPAKFLTGKTLENGWVVGENITKEFHGNKIGFAQTYLVERNGEKALLKALDFSLALASDDPPKEIIKLSKSYEFEKELLELCRSKNLTRIINIVEKGNIPPLPGSVIPVPYFILEYAEKDVKSQIDFDSRFNTAWLLKILHNVSVGLWQLHGQGVAHTELKPEHIREFSKSVQKLTELGASDRRGLVTPNKETIVIDDPSYLPPEHLYGEIENDWVYKSQATDIYNLGNLVFFLFTQANFNTWLFCGLDEINKNYRPDKWGGTFQEVLPYLVDAYDYSIFFFTAYIDDEELKSELEATLRQLCHPDPKRRGHPRNIASIGSSMSVERFISKFDRLSKIAELNLAKQN